MSLIQLGLVRGLIGQVLGTLVGMLIIVIFRALLGMDPVWSDEPAWVMGAVLGGVGFMLGVGAMDDWIKWMRGIPTPIHHGPPADKPAWARYFGVDYNHKVIGIQYGVTGLIMLMIGGSFAVIFRTELARSGLQFLDA
jgi:cytochrome c oxidase subunit 1